MAGDAVSAEGRPESDSVGTGQLPEVGARVHDTKKGRTGIVMDRFFSGTTVWLRPEAGGREWTSRPEDIEPAGSMSGQEHGRG